MKIEDIEKANSLKEKIKECELALEALSKVRIGQDLNVICIHVKDSDIVADIRKVAVEGLKAKIEECKNQIEEL